MLYSTTATVHVEAVVTEFISLNSSLHARTIHVADVFYFYAWILALHCLFIAETEAAH